MLEVVFVGPLGIQYIISTFDSIPTDTCATSISWVFKAAWLMDTFRRRRAHSIESFRTLVGVIAAKDLCMTLKNDLLNLSFPIAVSFCSQNAS